MTDAAMLMRFLLMVAVTANIWALPDVGPEYCNTASEGYHCAHCMQPVYCDQDGVFTQYDACTIGTVCDMTSGTAVCVDLDEAMSCWCKSNFCDAYNPDYVDYCNEDGIYDITDCAEGNPEYTCNQGECALPSTTTPPPDPFSCIDEGVRAPGWNFIYPECTTAYYCTGSLLNTANATCIDGQYVDENGDCQQAPPNPCAYSCSGYCPDETSCTHYYACDGAGGVLAGPFVCDDGFYFDPNHDPPFCSSVDDSVCSPLTMCDFSEYATTTQWISTGA